MAKMSKRRKQIADQISKDRQLPLEEALGQVKAFATAKFDETVEIAVNLNVDPRHADQMIRGSVVLPNGTGKTVRVLVFAKGEKAAEAEAAGADVVGADDLVEKIQGGWMEFDRVVATPDTMGVVGRLGRVLGPRGLMPNPKLGTVTFDVTKVVQEIKGGQATFRVDKAGIIHTLVGKASFSSDALAENVRTVMDKLNKMKPAAVKGTYVKRITVTSTMGPGIRVEVASTQPQG